MSLLNNLHIILMTPNFEQQSKLIDNIVGIGVQCIEARVTDK